MTSARWAWAKRRCPHCVTSTRCCASTKRSSCARRRPRSSSASSFATGTGRANTTCIPSARSGSSGAAWSFSITGCARASADSIPRRSRNTPARCAPAVATRSTFRISRRRARPSTATPITSTPGSTRNSCGDWALARGVKRIEGQVVDVALDGESRRHHRRSRSSRDRRSKVTSSSTPAASARCCSATSSAAPGRTGATGCPAIAPGRCPASAAPTSRRSRARSRNAAGGSGAFRCSIAPAMATCSQAASSARTRRAPPC